MIRFLRAFAWLRWRLMLNGVRGSRRRDLFEQVSRLLALALPAAIVALSLGSLLLVSVAGWAGGFALATGRFAPPDLIIFVARALLFGTTVLVVFMPVGGAAQTTGAKYQRLLLLPIQTRALHLVEVLSSLADPWILFVLPGLVLLAVGLFWGGRLDAALFAAAAGAALAMVLASMAALVSFVVSWVFRNRRRAELLTIVFVMAISLVALVPQLINGKRERREGGSTELTRGTAVIAYLDTLLPAWTAVVPSEAFGRVVASAAIDANRTAAAGWLVVLLAEGAVFFWLSGLVHRSLLKTAGGSSGRRQRTSPMRPPWRLPGLSLQATAVAWAMVKGGLRSVRGRVAVLLPGPLMAVVLLTLLRADEGRLASILDTNSHLVFGASLFIGVFAIQPFTMNQFASDRAGLTLQFLLPVSALDLVRGKAIGGGVLFLIAGAISCVASAVAAGGGMPLAWLLTALGGLATYVTITPIAALMSALFPVPADMSKAGAGGNPHAASALAGMFFGVVAVLPPLVMVAPSVLPITPSVALVVMAAWLCLVTVVAWGLLGLVARVVTVRRENLFLAK